MGNTIFLVPFVLQSCVLFFDEFYYHHKRGLPKWEIIGHPLDTLSVLIPMMFAGFFDYQQSLEWIFFSFSFFSCFFVVKDEWIHKDLCTREEMVCHGCLFVLHPLIFLGVYKLWTHASDGFFFQMRGLDLLKTQIFFVVSFLLYQIFYWGFYRANSNQQRDLSSTGRQMVRGL